MRKNFYFYVQTILQTAMRNIILLLGLFTLLISCQKEDDIDDPNNNNNNTPDSSAFSTKDSFKLIGGISMTDGPHNLLIIGDNLYAQRDYSIFRFLITNPANPVLQQTYVHSQNKSFGKMYSYNNTLYACNSDEVAIYVFGADLSVQAKYSINQTNFKPATMLIDSDGKYWIGGSNGSNGILLKCVLSSGTLNVQASWQATNTQSLITYIAEKDNHILASIANGDFLTFPKSNLSGGYVANTSFTNEPGHEKWGKTFTTLNNNAYWANWGAGLATVNVTNPANATVTKVLSNSMFRNQFGDAEGTDVYDVAYNSNHNVLCVANGWSGVFTVSPTDPEKVVDYIDPKYFQNACIATKGDYIYTGNISGGISGDLKGLKVFKFN